MKKKRLSTQKVLMMNRKKSWRGVALLSSYMITMMILFDGIRESWGYAYRLWGQWKLSVEDRNKNIPGEVSVKIYPRDLQIQIRKEYVGGVLTCQKELYGRYSLYSDIESKQTYINVHLENQISTIDSILGIQIRLKKEEQKRVRGRLTAKVLYLSQDIIALEVSNRIKKCDQWNDKNYECLLSRVDSITGEGSPSTPMNFFLIGQFVGLATSHTFDFTLSVIRSLVFHDNK
jgi:hypothetical protein